MRGNDNLKVVVFAIVEIGRVVDSLKPNRLAAKCENHGFHLLEWKCEFAGRPVAPGA
jgi:hypothetical protein